MTMKKLFFLLIVFMGSSMLNGMNNTQALSSTFPSEKDSFNIPGGFGKRGEKRLIDGTPKNSFLEKVKAEIYNFDPCVIEKMLSTEEAATIDDAGKEALCKHIDENFKIILDIQKCGNPIASNASNEEIKKIFSFSLDKQRNDLERIANLLRIFKFFKKLEFPKAFFTAPHCNGSLEKILIALVMHEQEAISVCCYHFTLCTIANALVEKAKQGVKVEVLTHKDQGNGKSAWDALGILAKGAVSVKFPKNVSGATYETNHNKFVIFKKNLFDKPLVWTGSFNFTQASNEYSWENALVCNDDHVVKKFSDEFGNIASKSVSFQFPV